MSRLKTQKNYSKTRPEMVAPKHFFEHSKIGMNFAATRPARPTLPSNASRPVKIHVREIKISESFGETHLGENFGRNAGF
ncbi:MAG: hypothetical protein IKC51_08980 [Myxococcaceae bacterium]|nr:hypothetical protein [Myxococcaceae bacterium]